MTALRASTPHGIHLFAPDCPDRIDPAGEHQPVRVLPGVDAPMRAGFEEVGWTEFDGIPVALLRPGAPTSLPPRVDGVRHVASTVSALAALAAGRDDILVNHRSVRDLDGRVIGARALGMFITAPPAVKTGRLIATRGLPGSGKTTWALQQPGWRANRDVLRGMQPGGWDHGDQEREDALTVGQLALVEAWLRAGLTVIADDTNLRPGVIDRLRALAEVCGAAFHLEDFTDVPVETCIARDAARPEAERVGEKVIRGMWERHLSPRAVVVALGACPGCGGLDGTHTVRGCVPVTSDVQPVEAGAQTLGEIK